MRARLGARQQPAVGSRPDDYLRMTLEEDMLVHLHHPCRIGALIANGRQQRDISTEFNRFRAASWARRSRFRTTSSTSSATRERYGKRR